MEEVLALAALFLRHGRRQVDGDIFRNARKGIALITLPVLFKQDKRVKPDVGQRCIPLQNPGAGSVAALAPEVGCGKVRVLELLRRNRVLYENHQSSLTDPFSYEQPTIDLSAYGVPDNTIGYLTIPRMDLVVPILLGANTDNMRLGAVHLTETSYPIGGENTNCILAAHRGMGTKAMFREIERMEIGDLLYIENFRETLTYRVVELRVIEPTDIDQLLIQEGRDLITLVTCHPYRHNYQRYVVLCERVEQENSVG